MQSPFVCWCVVSVAQTSENTTMHLRLSKCKRLNTAFNVGFWPNRRCFPYEYDIIQQAGEGLITDSTESNIFVSVPEILHFL